MMHRKLLMASAIIASVVVTACSDTTAPEQVAPGDVSFARSGTLRVTKECSEYFLRAGDFCTITSSNLKQIEVGSRVVYASALVNGKLDSDLILDPPGPGNNIAFGHVTLDLTTSPAHGLVTFSGGTGKFRHFRATVVVSLLNGGPDWKWDGPYSFSDKDDGSDEGGNQH
jgi:hypothetical protein